jgi:hypothetical protein
MSLTEKLLRKANHKIMDDTTYTICTNMDGVCDVSTKVIAFDLIRYAA